MTRKQDALEGAAEEAVASGDDSTASTSDAEKATPSPPADAGVMYSFDAARGPTGGSQILNTALAKAVQRFEEHETARLVDDEYEVLDEEGRSVGPVVRKKGKAKAKAKEGPMGDEDEYEFV